MVESTWASRGIGIMWDPRKVDFIPHVTKSSWMEGGGEGEN